MSTRVQGKVFGGLLLAAFVLYGLGSALEGPIGLTLIVLNSTAVIAAGAIGLRLVRGRYPGIGVGYLASRVAEAVLLAVGVAIVATADAPSVNDVAYQLAMIALGAGSVPFCYALLRDHWLPGWLARWGMIGYAALAAGALLQLVAGVPVAMALAAPGGTFELVVGLCLLRRGFAQSAATAPKGSIPTRDDPLHQSPRMIPIGAPRDPCQEFTVIPFTLATTV